MSVSTDSAPPPVIETVAAPVEAPSLRSRRSVDWQMPALERRCLLAFIWTTTLLYACATTVADPDLWGHTLYGLRALAQGRLVERTDPFSFTAPGSVWINHEWLTEMQFGWLWESMGGIGLVLWRNALVLGVFCVAGASLLAARASIGTALALWVYSALCLSGFCTFIRPQLATFFLFALTLWVLRRQWDQPRTMWLWCVPFLCGLWVNLHGGFLAGLGLVALFMSASIARAAWLRWGNRTGVALDHELAVPWRIVAAAVLAFAATLVNPYGFGLYEMLWHHLVPEQAVREWQPLWAARQAPMYYVPFLLLGIAILGSRRWQWIDVLVLAAVGFQAVSHIRHVALLCIAILVLLPGPLSDSLGKLFRNVGRQLSGDHRRWPRTALVAGALALMIGLEAPAIARLWQQGIAPWRIAVESTRQPPGVPLRAIQVMRREGVRGNVVTAYSWGQYVLWHLFPDSRVGFDGRYRTVYPHDVEDAFLVFRELDRNGPERTPMLDDYATEIVLWPASGTAADYLAGRPDWIEIYADDQARLFVRDLPKFSELIDRTRGHAPVAVSTPTFTRFPGGPVASPDPHATVHGNHH